MLRLFLLSLSCTFVSSALAHPMSHTDAWVTVSDVVDVRLNVFLDDVLRHQLPNGELPDQISRDKTLHFVSAHSLTLLQQLQIFQDGVPLDGVVVTTPNWKPDGESIDTAADASLKLTWDLRFSLPGGTALNPRALCILHQFSHPALDSPGELRLNLRRKGVQSRITATIPPCRPYTIVLPTSAGATPERLVDANAAVCRIVNAPAALVVEFSAPLLLVDGAWQDAAKHRDLMAAKRRSSNDAAASLTLIEAKAVQVEVSDWFAEHTELTVDGNSIKSTGIDVSFFANEEEPNDDESMNGDLPLPGMKVGVRLKFRPQRQAQRLAIQLHETFGLFREILVEVVDPAGAVSEIVTLNDSEANGMLNFAYECSASTSSAAESSIKVADTDCQLQQLPLIAIERPLWNKLIRLMAVASAVAFFLLVLSVWRGKWKSIYRSTFAGAALVAATVLFFQGPDVLSLNTANATVVTKHLMASVYQAVSQPKSDAVSELGEYLNDDLVESVYLSMVESMMTADTGEIFISFEQFVLDEASFEVPTQIDQVATICRWRARGTVYHWGHAHQRELVSTGTLMLNRRDASWKIGRIQLSGPVEIRQVMPEPRNS